MGRENCKNKGELDCESLDAEYANLNVSYSGLSSLAERSPNGDGFYLVPEQTVPHPFM